MERKITYIFLVFSYFSLNPNRTRLFYCVSFIMHRAAQFQNLLRLYGYEKREKFWFVPHDIDLIRMRWTNNNEVWIITTSIVRMSVEK